MIIEICIHLKSDSRITNTEAIEDAMQNWLDQALCDDPRFTNIDDVTVNHATLFKR